MERRQRPRLLLADDHTLIAEACKHLLEPEFEVVGIVENGRTLLKTVLEHKPDIVVLDIAMPRMNGLDAGARIKQLLPATKLVYLTMNMSPEVAAEAFRRGASAYVVKNAAASELITAIQRALASESYLSPLITRDTVDFLLRSGASYAQEKRITHRQSEVLQLVAEGMSMKEIAATLDLNPGTVAFHKYKIMENLGLKTNTELV
jgi:DNA-binding NarL/FixJ family response regulator